MMPRSLARPHEQLKRGQASPGLSPREAKTDSALRTSQRPLEGTREITHARFREQHLQLIRDAIAPRGGRRAPAAAVGLVEVLTRYSSWETLTKDHGLSDDQAAAAVLGALGPIITARRKKPGNARKQRATATQRGRAS